MPDDKPSLREFDYFDDAEKPVPPGARDEFDIPEGLEAQLLAFEMQRRKYWRQLFVSIVFFAVVVWLLSGYRDAVAYAFSDPHPPARLGDVVDADHSDMKHNSYVEVEGVTMHRGLRQKIVRGLGISRDDLHYFELSGSRGVLIEVDPERGIEFMNQVKVAGRVVDPKVDHSYDALLAEYKRRYFQDRRPEERIIQVGIEPGEGRGSAIGLLAFLAVLVALNLFTVVRIFRLRNARPIIRG